MSGIADNGQESGHGNIDAIDPWPTNARGTSEVTKLGSELLLFLVGVGRSLKARGAM
jgi:hypothetical protein